MHQQLATAARWLSEHGPALADLLAKPVAEPSTPPSTIPPEQPNPVDAGDLVPTKITKGNNREYDGYTLAA